MQFVQKKVGRLIDPLSELFEVHEIIKIDPPKGLLISKEYTDLYEKGCSIHEISRVTGKSRHWVREILRRHKISLRPKLSESQVTSWRKRPRTHAHPPFGYAYLQGQLVIEPREHEILLLIERLASQDLNPNLIAGHLNKNSLKPRRADLWTRNSVVLILKRIGSKN